MKILIIDDDKNLCHSLQQELEELNFAVKAIVKPNDLKTITESFDFAFIDLKFSNLSGLEIAKKIRQQNPLTKIIIMTGYGSIATAVEAMKNGAQDYLTKPIRINSILDIIKNKKVDIQSDIRGKTLSLDRVEREYIEYVLAQESGNISKAAKRLGIYRQSLQRKLKKYIPKD